MAGPSLAYIRAQTLPTNMQTHMHTHTHTHTVIHRYAHNGRIVMYIKKARDPGGVHASDEGGLFSNPDSDLSSSPPSRYLHSNSILSLDCIIMYALFFCQNVRKCIPGLILSARYTTLHRKASIQYGRVAKRDGTRLHRDPGPHDVWLGEMASSYLNTLQDISRECDQRISAEFLLCPP